MSVSMLLNAANVVKAAERCKAIDETTGRIPINFLLSRSNDLDDHVKHQLQQLAVSSPSISLNTSPPDQPPVTPLTTSASVAPLSSPTAPISSDTPMPPRSTSDSLPPSQSLISPAAHPLISSPPSSDNETDEDAALRDIDDASTRRPDRKLLRLKPMSRTTLTRKAIRKHSAAVDPSAAAHMPLLPPRIVPDGSSTIHTTSQPSSSSLSVPVRRMPIHAHLPTFNGRRDGTASMAAASNSDDEADGGGMVGNIPRRRWKQWEDQLLIQVVSEHGPSRWNTLARHFPGRNGRQVRLRWMNHLQPSLDKRPWRPDEDAVLLEAHKALGNKWALISMRLCGRTDNSVKNRYKSIVRRAAREAKARK